MQIPALPLPVPPPSGQLSDRRDSAAREQRPAAEQATTLPVQRSRDGDANARRVLEAARSDRARLGPDDNVPAANRDAIQAYLSNRPSVEEQLGVELAGIDERV